MPLEAMRYNEVTEPTTGGETPGARWQGPTEAPPLEAPVFQSKFEHVH